LGLGLDLALGLRLGLGLGLGSRLRSVADTGKPSTHGKLAKSVSLRKQENLVNELVADIVDANYADGNLRWTEV
jgi:hypothetical protein